MQIEGERDKDMEESDLGRDRGRMRGINIKTNGERNGIGKGK